jgi:predicted metalloendopeptidase
MLELISYLRRVFKDIVNKADWMDDITKEEALKKVKVLKLKLLIEK